MEQYPFAIALFGAQSSGSHGHINQERYLHNSSTKVQNHVPIPNIVRFGTKVTAHWWGLLHVLPPIKYMRPHFFLVLLFEPNRFPLVTWVEQNESFKSREKQRRMTAVEVWVGRARAAIGPQCVVSFYCVATQIFLVPLILGVLRIFPILRRSRFLP